MFNTIRFDGSGQTATDKWLVVMIFVIVSGMTAFPFGFSLQTVLPVTDKASSNTTPSKQPQKASELATTQCLICKQVVANLR